MDPAKSTATMHEPAPCGATESDESARITREIAKRYRAILQEHRLNWTEHHRLIRLLGSGSHGLVYLSEGRGSDDFSLPVALKIFSPERYGSERGYSEAMRQVARVAAQVAKIQQDNLVDVHHWFDRGWIRVMEMEWIDGFDLRRLLTQPMFERLRSRTSPERFHQLNEVVITEGMQQPRLKPGVAMAIVRDCLAALDALHCAGIVHADVKPANLMLKRTGDAKLVDLGSAFLMAEPPLHPSCTPAYAAPEVLKSQTWSPRADLASLGYVLVEMLSGVPMSEGIADYQALWEAKMALPDRLPHLLPPDVVRNDLLLGFCRRLIAVDPAARFVTAEEADLAQGGAAGFHRQLIKGDMASEYYSDIRRWLQDLGE
jgi:serine/threonine-protein kinase